jgi:predicted O-methyltransferase YrrM
MNYGKELTIPGWCPVELMQKLNKIVSEMPKNQFYLEIGSFCGRSLVAALKENNAQAYVIDPQDLKVGNTTTEIWWNKTVLDFGVKDRIKLYKCKTEEFNGNLRKPIGVFFYDGNHDSGHTYEALNKFAKFLANDAIIIVDDYNIHGGNEQTPFPGHKVDINCPVKVDTDRWIQENKDHIVDVKYTDWLNGQAIICWSKAYEV